MNNYTLVPLTETNEDSLKLKALTHLLTVTPTSPFELGLKGSLSTHVPDITTLKRVPQLRQASQLRISLHLVELGETVNLQANHVEVLFSRLFSTVNSLLDNDVKFEVGDVEYTYGFMESVKVDTMGNTHSDNLLLDTATLFNSEYLVFSIDNRLKLFNRNSFLTFLTETYSKYGEKIPFEIYFEGSYDDLNSLEKFYEILRIPHSQEFLLILDGEVKKNYSVVGEVEDMLQQVKYFLKGAKPLTNEELRKVNIRRAHIKQEIGELGATYDEDIFELLAILEVQVGEERLRNLNISLRILVALQRGLKEVEVSATEVIDTKNLVLPSRFMPFTPIDALHAYCGILSLTANKRGIEGLDVPLDYLKSKLSTEIGEDDYAFAFVDGIIRYLNKKDGTNIKNFKGYWGSNLPLHYCEEFIESAFSQASVLKGKPYNQVYFLYYILYNLLK